MISPGTHPAAGPRRPTPDPPTGAAEVGHTHADIAGGWLRAAVFGAMDGLVTSIALIAGVGGGGASARIIVLSGLAGLVAGAFSMALGEFTSVSTQNDALNAEARTEAEELHHNPEAEKAELVDMYVQMGLSRATATRVAEEVHASPELAVRVHLTQELGLDPDDKPSPWTAASSSFLSFAVGAVIPLLPYLFGLPVLWAGLGVGALGLFAAGCLFARFTVRGWLFSGARQLLFGAVAAAASFGVGTLIGAGT